MVASCWNSVQMCQVVVVQKFSKLDFVFAGWLLTLAIPNRSSENRSHRILVCWRNLNTFSQEEVDSSNHCLFIFCGGLYVQHARYFWLQVDISSSAISSRSLSVTISRDDKKEQEELHHHGFCDLYGRWYSHSREVFPSFQCHLSAKSLLLI